MFTLDNYTVEFKLGVRKNVRVFGVDVLIKDITLCTITENYPDGEKDVYHGASIRSYSDKYSAHKGRKEAFTRVVKAFDEETRKRLWDKFFEVYGK